MNETDAIRAEPPKAFRWAVLVLISLAMFGNYYVYDSISPLADVLKAQLGFSDANIGWLYAIYSIPNIVLVLLGGIVIDRIGTRRATLLFGVLCFAGAVLTALSGTFAVMMAGRFVFGLGAESLIVAVTTAIAKWFRGKELSFAFGVNLTIARLGSVAALNSPSWATPAYVSWQWPLLIGVGFATFCITGALLYWVLETRADERYDLGAESTDKVVWGDLFRFGTSYWLVVGLCITFYSAIFPFQTFAVKFFMEAHGTSRETGGFLSSLLNIFAMIFTPLFGLLVDKVGKRAVFMMFGSLLLVPVYLMMAYTRMPALVLFDVHVPFVEYGVSRLPADRDDGDRLLAHPRRHVALGRLPRGPVEARHGVRSHDDDPEHRPLRLQRPDRLVERPLAGHGREPRRATRRGCGCSRCSASRGFSSPGSCAAGRRGPTRTGSRRSPRRPRGADGPRRPKATFRPRHSSQRRATSA